MLKVLVLVATTLWTNDPCVMSEAPLAVKNETTDMLNIL